MPRPALLDVLRAETQAVHDRLDSGLPLMDAGLTRADYRALLERFWGFLAPAEPRVLACGAWPALGLEAAPRARLPSLEADLRWLGHDDASLARLSHCPRPPRLDTVPQVLGYLYVFEGATLGGALIARRLRRTLGLAPARGAAFFGGRGRRVGPMWQAFTRALSRYAERTGSEREIVAGACETFHALEPWLLRRTG